MMQPLIRSAYSTMSNESTPLVPPRTVGARNSGNNKQNNNNALKQRNPNASHHQQESVPPVQDSNYCAIDSKEDRRSFFGRLLSNMKSIIPSSSYYEQWIPPTSFLRNNKNNNSASSNNNEQQQTQQQQQQDMYYEDYHNDDSWKCSFGTKEEDGIWINSRDRVGTFMSTMVWVLIAYSGMTVCLLVQYNNLSPFVALCYITLSGLALASHVKTTLTDPGSIPHDAVPIDVYSVDAHTMCSRCQSYKPPMAHHCRICDRCISRMDHHCPWMNNCVGAGNLKHFILFLLYIWTLCAFALLVFGFNYFFCTSEECQFNIVTVQLVRVMTLIAIATLLFTSSMLTNVTFGIITGIGTIDRLKKKTEGTWDISDERPLELEEIFGIGHYASWCLPVDPVFKDYDTVMGYSTPQRLLREQTMYNNNNNNVS